MEERQGGIQTLETQVPLDLEFIHSFNLKDSEYNKFSIFPSVIDNGAGNYQAIGQYEEYYGQTDFYHMQRIPQLDRFGKFVIQNEGYIAVSPKLIEFTRKEPGISMF